MIPKTIHYCWFGKGEMSENAKKCIDSWRKYFSEYEIIEWNESNFDLDCCDYVREAYGAKKWAFVSDYARFQILYKFGGVYFDTDVEVIKSFDSIVHKGSFMGFQQGRQTLHGVEYEVNPGLGLASVPGLEIFKEVLDNYHTIHFINEDGGQNFTTIVQYTTDILKKYGMINKPEIHCVAGINLYPPEYFCPLNFNTGEMNITPNTYSIHHFMASWFSKLDWCILTIERAFSGGSKIRYLSGQVIILPFRFVRKIKNLGIVATIKLIISKIKGKG
jgi:hypothetical protein